MLEYFLFLPDTTDLLFISSVFFLIVFFFLTFYHPICKIIDFIFYSVNLLILLNVVFNISDIVFFHVYKFHLGLIKICIISLLIMLLFLFIFLNM